MNVFLKLSNGQYTLNIPEQTTTQYYRITPDGTKVLVDQPTSIQTPMLVFAKYNQKVSQFKIQPIDDKHLPDTTKHAGSVAGLNILTNISGLINTTEFNNIYTLAMAIGDEIDEIVLKNLYKVIKEQNEGTFTVVDETLAPYLNNYPDKVYFYIKSRAVNGYIEVKVGTTQYIPFGVIPQSNINMFNSIKPIKHLKGKIDIEEDLWIEPVLDLDSKVLKANLFGGQTGLSYKLMQVQNNVDDFYGLDFNGQYIYQLIKTAAPSSKFINFANNTETNLWLVKYNVLTQDVESTPVQYDPIDIQGIKILGNLLLINDVQGVVVFEKIDASYQLDIANNTIKVNHPFDGINILNQTENGTPLTDPLNDSNELDSYLIRVFTTQQNKLINPKESIETQYNNYSYFVTNSISNNFVYDDVFLTPTYIDSLAYLFSVERGDLEFVGELFVKIKLENVGKSMYMPTYLYPIPVDFTYTADGDNAILTLLSPASLPADYVVLTPQNYKLIFEEITDYTTLFSSDTELKNEIKTVLSIADDNQIERVATVSLDGTIEQPLVLLDGTRTIPVKYYLTHLVIEDEFVYKATSTQPNYWLNPKVDLYEQLSITDINSRLYVTKTVLPSPVEAHTYTIEKLIDRNVSAGRIIGLVSRTDKTEIRYIYNN